MHYVINSLEDYVKDRIPTGGFLYAVLTNNLMEACIRADERNQSQLPEIMCYIYNNLPTICYGSPEKVEKWINRTEMDEVDDD
jgi:hypothetical protein